MTFDLIREWLGGGLVVAGAVFTVIGAIGVLRMPDVFTRMHASSVSDTLGGGLILVGLILLAGVSLVAVKLLFLAVFFGLMSPVATHAVARSALHAGVIPALAEGVEAETISQETPKSKR